MRSQRSEFWRSARWVVVPAVCLLAGCAGSGPMMLQLERKEAVEAPARAEGRCVMVYLAPVKAESFGVLEGRTVVVDGFAERLREELEGLRTEKGVRVQVTRKDGEVVVAKVSVVKANLGHVYVSKTASVVLKLERGSKVDYFRGRETAVNWWGAKDEYASAMERAMADAVKKLGAELLKEEDV